MSFVLGDGYRPGPSQILPGGAPGGVVVHVYGEDGRLLVARGLHTPAEAAVYGAGDAATADARLRPAEAVCLVAFDGDTGVRWTPADWERWLEAGGLG